MPNSFRLATPLPGRNAFAALRDQLLAHLESGGSIPGEAFYSENELARIAGVSRNTVRKSLDGLVRDGWLERRQGTGTFVGSRTVDSAAAAIRSASTSRSNGQARDGMLRLGVLLGLGAGPRTGWYAMEVLRGMESAAAAERISIELLGMDGGLEHLRRRIEQTRPDVLACLSPDQSWAMMIAEARSRQIPVLTTGTRLLGIGVPVIHEENVESTKAAVRHLADQGHTRIAFFQDTVPARWAVDRYHGYVEGMTACGLEADPALTLWVRQEGGAPVDPRIATFLAKRHATALLIGSAGLLRFVGPAINAVGLSVPRDLALVCFDQAAREVGQQYGFTTTTMTLPLVEMGQTLARYARRIADAATVPELTVLPCRFVEGGSTAGPPTPIR